MIDAPTLPQPQHATPCIRCGYDLRGHDAGGRCPECGMEASWSVRAPQQLAQYPASWVNPMSWGTRLMALAYGTAFIAMIAGFLGYFPRNEDAGNAVFITLALAHAIGAWMLARNSGHYTEPAAPINRLSLRVTPILLLLGGVAMVFMQHNYRPGGEWIVIALLYAGMTAPVAIFIRLRKVARMVADEGLAEHSAIVAWGFFSTMIALGAYSAWEAISRATTLNILRMFTMGAILTMLLLFVLWGAFIMICCVRDFGRAAKVARAEWKASEPPV